MAATAGPQRQRYGRPRHRQQVRGQTCWAECGGGAALHAHGPWVSPRARIAQARTRGEPTNEYSSAAGRPQEAHGNDRVALLYLILRCHALPLVSPPMASPQRTAGCCQAHRTPLSGPRGTSSPLSTGSRRRKYTTRHGSACMGPAQREVAAHMTTLRRTLSLIVSSPNRLELYTTLTGAPVPEVALDKWARRQLLTAHSQQPLQELTKTVAGLLDVLYLVDCHSMTLTVGSVVDGILLAISKGMPAGDFTVAELDKSNCAWLARELQPHLARLMQSNTVHLHVLALLTAQTAQRMFSSGEANVSMADLDRRLYGALAECRGLMAGAALQAVSLYVALRVTLKAEEWADLALKGLPRSLVDGYLRHLGWELSRQFTALLGTNLAAASELPDLAESLAKETFGRALAMMAQQDARPAVAAMAQQLQCAADRLNAWLPKLKVEIATVGQSLLAAANGVEDALAAQAQQAGPGGAPSVAVVDAVAKLRNLMFCFVAERPEGGLGLQMQPQEMGRQLAWAAVRFAVNIDLQEDLPALLPHGLDAAAQGLLGGKMGVWVEALMRASKLLAPPGCDPQRARLFGDVLQVCCMASPLIPAHLQKPVRSESLRMQAQLVQELPEVQRYTRRFEFQAACGLLKSRKLVSERSQEVQEKLQKDAKLAGQHAESALPLQLPLELAPGQLEGSECARKALTDQLRADVVAAARRPEPDVADLTYRMLRLATTGKHDEEGGSAEGAAAGSGASFGADHEYAARPAKRRMLAAPPGVDLDAACAAAPTMAAASSGPVPAAPVVSAGPLHASTSVATAAKTGAAGMVAVAPKAAAAAAAAGPCRSTALAAPAVMAAGAKDAAATKRRTTVAFLSTVPSVTPTTPPASHAKRHPASTVLAKASCGPSTPQGGGGTTPLPGAVAVGPTVAAVSSAHKPSPEAGRASKDGNLVGGRT